VSHEGIKASVDAESKSILWLVLGLSLAAALLASYFSLFRTRPLKRITDATKKIAGGEFGVSLPLKDGTEIGTLARSFQGMIEQVRKRDEEVREREARIRTILDTAAEGIIIIDEQGTIDSFNKSAERIFGYTADEARGQDVRLLHPPASRNGDRASPVHPVVAQARKNLGLVHEVIGRRKDGTEFPMELSVSEVKLGDRAIFTAIVRDITERKQSEGKIRELNEHLSELNEGLENRVQGRTAELRKANEELEVARDQAMDANRTKSQFLASMSHELRTPLNAIIGYSEMLLEDAEDSGHEDSAPDLRKIHSAGKHLLTLINDILDLSKIEAGKIELFLETFELTPMIQDVATTIRPLVEKNANQLEVQCVDGLGKMHADLTRLRQCLFNLLSNAVKFTDNGVITLQVSREQRTSGDWIC